MHAEPLDPQRDESAHSHSNTIRVPHLLKQAAPLDSLYGASGPSAGSTIPVLDAASQELAVSHSRVHSKAPSTPSISCHKVAASESMRPFHVMPSPSLDCHHHSHKSFGLSIQTNFSAPLPPHTFHFQDQKSPASYATHIR
ncbi:hypothetical protein SESBI_38641 [Sesbania bispinosa]|nr:hypothetical protein SESBI_38641 [Sesbania bispinosa]